MTPLRSTVADVDLDAIAANVVALRASAKADVIAVVKADAYGHGAEAVAATAAEAGAAMLAVFTVEEGVALRRAGVAAPLLVLGGAGGSEEAAAAVADDMAVVVWDPGRAELLARAAGGRGARCHFKVDTGLTRLGAPLEEALDRYRAIAALPGLSIEGVFTHYASSDEPGDTFTGEQLERFRGFLGALPERPRWVHAAASAAVAGAVGADPCNAVRPGLALYGLHAAPHLAGRVALRPALSWRSRVERVAAVPAGTGVSYGHEYRLARDGRIATVPVGYGDGLLRSSSGASLLVRGRPAPIVGRVCMDLVMLDVSDLPSVAAGDEVVLIGEQEGARSTAEDLAAVAGTINYEVVTNLKPRVPRRYWRRGRLVATKTLADGYRPC